MGEAIPHCPRDTEPREVSARRVEESQVQDSERALVPLGSGCAGPPPVPGGRIDMPRLLAAAVFGLAVEAQRRSLNAAGAVAGRLGWPLRVLARPAVAVARGSVAVAGHHLNLDGWAAPGTGRTATCAGGRRQCARTLIAALVDGLVSRMVDRILLRDGQRQTDPLHGQLQP
jgi:hypothetical protein